MPVKYFSIDGIATYLRHTGPTTLPEQPPELTSGELLLCLHFSGGNGGNFAALFAQLKGKHSPLAFDFPGHDRSGELDSLGSIERMADFTGAFSAKLGLRPSVLLGHEMGAAVALQRALDAPSSVRALVLCAGAAKFEYEASALERARLVTEGKARREFDPTLFSKATPPEILRSGFMDTLKTDPRVIYPNLLACRDWSPGAALGALEVPTLVCTGADETPERSSAAKQLLEALPNARALRIPEAARMLPIEQAAALAEGVSEFLEELP